MGGGKSKFRPELPAFDPKAFPLRIINKDYINFNGVTLPLNIGLTQGIASMIRYHQWEPEKVEVVLYASEGVENGHCTRSPKGLEGKWDE